MSRSIWQVALVIVAALLVVNARLLLAGQTWDDVRFHTEIAPPRLAAADQALHGDLPTWWDGVGLGVPLWAEPSHGAAYPPLWLAGSPRVLELVILLHLFWCALGVALWARRRRASDVGAIVAAVLVMTTGVLASAAIRGALLPLAHLPWIALAARSRRWTVLGVLVAMVGLAGQLAVLVHAIAIALLATGKHRHGATEKAEGIDAEEIGLRSWRAWRLGGSIFWAIAGGLAIACVQWIPAALLHGTGATVHGLRLARVIELVVPTTSDGAFPSIYIGAAALALGAIGSPKRRYALFAGALALLALIAGRGGWPAWLGPPELHIATLAIVACLHAATGVDVVLAGQRRGLIALAGAAVATGIAVAGLAIVRTRVATPALDRALVAGVIAALAFASAFVVAWRMREGLPRALAVVALVVAPSVVAQPAVAPTRSRLGRPRWAELAAAQRPAGEAPQRVFRPIALLEGPRPEPDTVESAVATLAGASAARWGVGACSPKDDDPARPPGQDAVWLAAASAGASLLERYGIALAILPASNVRDALATRGSWSLTRVPASPVAALVFEWIWSANDAAAIARLFPPASPGLPSGLIILRGRGADNQDEPSPAAACAIERWRPGAIDLSCDAPRAAAAVISSSTADGWRVRIDGRDAPWQTADVIRRAVLVPPGAHRIAWRYRPPGLFAGLVLAVAGIGVLFALWLRR